MDRRIWKRILENALGGSLAFFTFRASSQKQGNEILGNNRLQVLIFQIEVA